MGAKVVSRVPVLAAALLQVAVAAVAVEVLAATFQQEHPNLLRLLLALATMLVQAAVPPLPSPPPVAATAAAITTITTTIILITVVTMQVQEVAYWEISCDRCTSHSRLGIRCILRY